MPGANPPEVVMNRIARLTALTLAALLLPATARAGGIHMAATRASAPFARDARQKVLLLDTFECGRAHDFKVQAVAEGVVNGRRASIPLTVTGIGEPGRFAIARAWPLEGEWLIVVTARAYDHTANLVLRLESNGGFVPESGSKDGVGFIELKESTTIRRKLDAKDIEALLAGKSIEDKAEARRGSVLDRVARAVGL
jgi:hypothetical protein